jgi:hypothetical protein
MPWAGTSPKQVAHNKDTIFSIGISIFEVTKCIATMFPIVYLPCAEPLE